MKTLSQYYTGKVKGVHFQVPEQLKEAWDEVTKDTGSTTAVLTTFMVVYIAARERWPHLRHEALISRILNCDNDV